MKGAETEVNNWTVQSLRSKFFKVILIMLYRGVAQGSVLGSLLFHIYASNITSGLENFCPRFATEIKELETANKEAIQGDLDNVY